MGGRGHRVAAGLAAIALFAGACGGGEEQVGPADEATDEVTDSGDEATGTDDTTSAEGASGGTLVVAIGSDPGSLNPAATTNGGVHAASEILFNGLVELDDDLQPVPELAESWEVLDDGRRYVFHLRDDVTWHDGEPFTSEDVRFTFEEVLLQLHARTAASMGDALESIETPDEHTVVFDFAFPYSPLLRQLDVTEAPIVPEHVLGDVEGLQNADFNTAPVGTGPFQFVSYEPDDRITYEANPDYFEEGLPLADELILQIIPDEGNQLIALEQEEVDFLWGVPGPELERIGGDDAFETLRTARNPGGANCIMTVSFNLERPTLQDQRVRQALAHAVDREAFVDTVLFGQGRAAEAPISSGIPFAHVPEVGLPEHDPERAEELLDEAGWVREGDGVRTASGVEGVEDGTPLELQHLAFPAFTRYGELLREQLRGVGVDLVLEPLEPPVFVERVFTDREFDTNLISYCNGTDPQIGVRRMYDSSQIGPVPFSNAAAYENPRVDQLFDEASRTVDEEEQRELYQEFTEIVVDELPYLWLVETESVRAFRAACSGFRPYSLFAEEATCG